MTANTSYFPTQPGSRFLANASGPSPTLSGAGAPSLSRLPAANQSVDDAPVMNGNGPHPLRNTWVYWFRQQRSPGNKIVSYEDGIRRISSFDTVESFWTLWTHLSPPSGLQPTTDYLLFHSGIERPVWEDPLNITGGKWIIRLKKGVSDRIWEDLVLAIIGEQFDTDPTSQYPEICGCTISVRQHEDIISLWNRIDSEPKTNRIRDTIRRVLNLTPATVMEYKSNNDSMQDKSSFRNSAVDRTPAS
ncbi:eukaryotic translation initiation factor 4E class II [Cylindrobasidium torrendii FP15055 ss-10]|uniref:Eukaryotic translation initiation factor 4E class II n=1 Tax=Cylindrobasidium torrendii FP15055 ss-10 TaxID=1314674 RepID=A0A0D7BED7_9AGAR|nr:eukaryotic translation initiation factor 4E class II [Cylindrobasidium torrendii FP15055 ss-10]